MRSLLIMVIVGLSLGANAFEAPAPERPAVIAAQPLIKNLSESLRPVTSEHYQARLTLHQAISRGEDPAADLKLRSSMVDGDFKGGSGNGRPWKHITIGADSHLAINAQSAQGTLTLDVQIAENDHQLTLILEANTTVVKDPPEVPNLALEGRWWRIGPSPQHDAYALDGSYRLLNADGSLRASGKLTGKLSLPLAPGLWDMGYPTKKGIQWTFHMGETRQNWNHVRLAQYTMPGDPVDLSDFHGLRIRVGSEQPRHDVGLSVWLREHGGGWYYVKDGIPLVATENEAVLLWEDFDEAEWVSPGNHMDSDFTLNVSAISHIAIGVVNPLGVGAIPCHLLSIETVRCAVEPRDPAEVAVSGRLLSVNDHEMIPVGMFGGYSPELPQRFRPGSQRVLHFALTDHPVIPRQRSARLNQDDIIDATTLARRIAQQSQQDGHPNTWKVLNERFRERYIADWLKEDAPNEKSRQRRARRLASALNDILSGSGLYESQTWDAIPLPEGIQAQLQHIGDGSSLTTTEVMELNRDLLHAAYPEHIAPRPAYGPTEKFIIDCQGERLHPGIYFRRDDWREYLFELGRRYAINARKAGHRAVMEFWNEPYLNWAERSRIHFRVKYFRQDLAVAGGPVTVKRDDPSKEEVIPHFQWAPARDDRVSQTEDGLMVIDTSAFSYWSGRGNGYIYDQMYEAIASGIRQENPDVVCVAGWGFRWHEDHWAVWDTLYRPTIDNNIDLIDGLNEHHYQGDPSHVLGSYEVLTAYGVTAHDRWLYGYNTETNDLVDAPARGQIEVPKAVENENNKNYRRAIYNLRDILFAVSWMPDKAASRTVIHHNHTPHGTEVAYGMMRDLRGRLVEGTSDDDRVWVVAAIDGSDPAAMPPESGQRLVVMLFNDYRNSRTVNLSLTPPHGTQFADGAFQARTVFDPSTSALSLERQNITDVEQLQVTMQGRSALLVQVPLNGEIGGPAEVIRKQFFSPDLLHIITPDEPLETTVTLDPDLLAQADRAWLRILVENVHPGAALVQVGDHQLQLPTALTRDNGNRLFMIPVPTQALAETTDLSFVLSDGHSAYRVAMTSLVLEHHSDTP